MIGFFEHQYLSYKKNHIKNLLALARVDGNIHPEEIALLFRIGKGYGLKEKQVQSLIDSQDSFELNIPDNHNDKMNLLFDLVQMVFADGVIDKHEIDFCDEAVRQFGMKPELLQYMIDLFQRKGYPTPEEWEEVKTETEERFKFV